MQNNNYRSLFSERHDIIICDPLMSLLLDHKTLRNARYNYLFVFVVYKMFCSMVYEQDSRCRHDVFGYCICIIWVCVFVNDR